MRVLHVMAGNRRRGAQAALLGSALALSEAGITQQVILDPEDAAGAAALLDGAIPVVKAAFGRGRRDPTRQQILRAVGDFSPNVVHYWSGRAASFAPRPAAGLSLGWHSVRGDLRAFRNCAWHAAANERLARRLVARGAAADRIGVLAPYAPPPAVAAANRAAIGAPEGAPLVLAVARRAAGKGMATLLSALSGLPGVHAWIAGRAGDEAEGQRLAERLGLADRVRFVAPAAAAWHALLPAADIVVFPARGHHQDDVAAAWAAGKPVIRALSADGAPEFDEEGAALLAPWADAAALDEALRALLEDASLARRLTERGRRAYEARFTKTAFVRAAMTLYDRIRTAGEQIAAA